MSEFIINKARTCAVTGHRILPKSFDLNVVKSELENLIENGYDTFLVGMALGFDTECFKILEDIKKKKNIRIIACIPCKNQSLKFNKTQKEEYDNLISKADEKLYVSEDYSSGCMQKRNKYMVDNSSCLVAYLRRDYGGSASTVKYAINSGVKIIYI